MKWPLARTELGIHLLGDLNGLACIGKCPVEVVSPRRCQSHPGQGRALPHPIPSPTGEGQEALTLGPGALEVAQDEVEIRLGLVDRHQGLGVHRVAEMARRLQSLVIEGERLAGGEGLCRLLRRL